MIRPGLQIGSIRVGELLSEGGMGEVYVGFDEKLQREVALKAIRGDRLDQRTRSRLLYEARVLSQLEHPNICRIYDFLESEDGGFLVLELVRGKNLRQVLTEGLSQTERLRIAEEIAQALIVAHTKGIIHRDLKLENVMLTAEGTVKVLDFGLARVFDEDPPHPAVPTSQLENASTGSASWVPSTYDRTVFGSIIGTLSTMSPEQARGETATAASDMYSLGLLLQELLTGAAPYEANLPRHLLQVKAAEGDTLPVMGLSADLTSLIERLKALEPYSRPNAAYVAERLSWIRARPARLRLRLIAATAVLLLVLLGVKYTVDLERERRAAVEARDEAEEVTRFLVDLFKVSDPGTARGQTITAREILDRSAERIVQELEERPLTQARLLDTVGTVYQQLGLYEEAAPLLEQGLALRRETAGDESLAAALSWHHLGTLEQSRGNHSKAEEYLLEALELREELAGYSDPLVAQTLNSLAANYGIQGQYDKAEPAVRRSLTIREQAFGPESIEAAASLQILAALIGSQGKIEGAGELYQRVIDIRERELGTDHPDLVRSLVGLAVIRQQLGEYDRSEALLKRAVEIQTKVLGADHYDLSLTLFNLAVLYNRLQREGEAEPLLWQALTIRERIFGEDHPRNGNILRLLAQIRSQQGRHSEAYALLKRNLESYRQHFGDGHPTTLGGWRDLATAYYLAEAYGEAETTFKRARDLALARVEADPESAEKRLKLTNFELSLGEVQRLAGHPEAAHATWRTARDRVAPLADGTEDLDILGAYATVLLCLEEVEKARPLVETLVAAGWSQSDFIELAKKHGLLPEE